MAAPTTTTAEPWATAADVCHPCVVEGDGAIDADVLASALRVATDVVWALSGRQFSGLTTETVRPLVSRRCQMRSWRHELDLGRSPLVSIGAVKIGVDTLDPDTYRIDDYRWLVRLDASWPTRQELLDADGEEHVFTVELTYGTAPPEAGVSAVAALACQLALACDEETAGECALPKRVTSITRQGLTMAVMDPFEFLDDGKTGVYEVDLFVKSYNPSGLVRPASVLSPDSHRRSRRVGT